MKILLVVLLLFIYIADTKAQVKRALIVGIGNYPAESGWNSIHGDNDIPLINQALLQLGFLTANIEKLTNQQATYGNITRKLKNLISNAGPDDFIYIHFSTHGQQVLDISGDEKDSLDEAIIPYDAGKVFIKGRYEGQRHLLDDELNQHLSALRKKIGNTGSIVVTLDACHSGDATRGDGKETDSLMIRGTGDIFQMSPDQKRTHPPLSSVDWVAISAAQPYQNNYEYRKNGHFYGSLSYAITLAFPHLTPEDDFHTMFKLIMKKREEMNVSRYPQRPMIEGNLIYMNRKIFK